MDYDDISDGFSNQIKNLFQSFWTTQAKIPLCCLRVALLWRHNGRDSVSNHQPHDCLLNRLFRRRSKKTSKLCVTGLCAGNSPWTGKCFHLITSSWVEKGDSHGECLVVSGVIDLTANVYIILELLISFPFWEEFAIFCSLRNRNEFLVFPTGAIKSVRSNVTQHLHVKISSNTFNYTIYNTFILQHEKLIFSELAMLYWNHNMKRPFIKQHSEQGAACTELWQTQ